MGINTVNDSILRMATENLRRSLEEREDMDSKIVGWGDSVVDGSAGAMSDVSPMVPDTTPVCNAQSPAVPAPTPSSSGNSSWFAAAEPAATPTQPDLSCNAPVAPVANYSNEDEVFDDSFDNEDDEDNDFLLSEISSIELSDEKPLEKAILETILDKLQITISDQGATRDISDFDLRVLEFLVIQAEKSEQLDYFKIVMAVFEARSFGGGLGQADSPNLEEFISFIEGRTGDYVADDENED